MRWSLVIVAISLFACSPGEESDFLKTAALAEKGDPSAQFKLGNMYTNEQGQYKIETIVPGRYAIPPGIPGLEKWAGHTRPAHIHFRVMESVHSPVTTQLYFKGDPFIADDPWADHKPSLAIDLTQDGNVQRGVFDIVLDNAL